MIDIFCAQPQKISFFNQKNNPYTTKPVRFLFNSA